MKHREKKYENKKYREAKNSNKYTRPSMRRITRYEEIAAGDSDFFFYFI